VGFASSCHAGKWAGGGGPKLLRGADDLPKPRVRRRHAPHAELESGVSVGTSGREVKTTTRVRVAPRILHFRPILSALVANRPIPGRPDVAKWGNMA